MGTDSVRTRLRRAAREVEAACEGPASPEERGWLEGIAEQFNYYVDGDVSDPEALAYPPPGALDTIQQQLDEVCDRTDDEALQGHLSDARAQIIQAIVSLDGRVRSEQSFPTEDR